LSSQARTGPRFSGPPEFSRAGENVIVGSARWLAPDGRVHERFQVLSIRGGEIVDIQGCATRREADRVARRRSRSVP
jgi:hypothetical protein